MDLAREFRRYLKLIVGWLWLIILGGLLAGGVNYYLTTNAPAHYQASTTLMVGQFIRQANPNQSEVDIADRLSSYYLELLRRQPVIDGVKQELNLNLPDDQLAGMVVARIVPGTAFIEVSVSDTDPIRVVKLVNSFAHQLIKQSPTAPENQRKQQSDFIQKQLDDLQSKIEDGRKLLIKMNSDLNNATTAAEISDLQGQIKAQQSQIDAWQGNYTNLLKETDNSSSNSIDILETANQSHKEKNINPLISSAITAGIGSILALVVAILLEYLDDRIKTPDDIMTRFKLTVLGNIPNQKRKKASNKNVAAAFITDSAQAYEILCTNILFSDMFKDGQKALLITSPETLKEQAEISSNLAIATVSYEKSVLLIDANTRLPQLHRLMGFDNQPGFFETFYGNSYMNLEERILETAVPNLYLMPAGIDSPDSTQVVAVTPGTQQIYNLPDEDIPGDFVIFNCGSILNDKTTRLLASRINAVVLVCELNRTRGQELKAAVQIVNRLKGTVLGIVTIKVSRRPNFPLRFSRKKHKPDSYGFEDRSGTVTANEQFDQATA